MTAGGREDRQARLAGLGRHLAASRLVRGAGGSVAIAGGEKLLMLAASVALARVLGPSGFGAYAYAIAVAGFLAIPAQFGLRNLLTREIAANAGRGRWDLVHGLLQRSWQLSLVTTGSVSVVTLAVVWLAPLDLSVELKWVMTLAVAFLGANVFTQLAGAVLMGLRQVVHGQWPRAIGRPALFLAGIGLVGVARDGHLTALDAMALNLMAGICVLVVTAEMARRSLRRHAQPDAPAFANRAWLASAIPFAVLSGLTQANAQIDVLILGALTAPEQVGHYRVAAAGAALVPVVHMAINQAIGPSIAHLHARDEPVRMARIVRVAALSGATAGAAILAVFAIWGEAIIGFVYGLAYQAAWPPLLILSCGMLVNAAFGPAGLVLNMTGHERATAYVFGAGAAANVVLNFLLIPRFGILGAALSTAITTATVSATFAVLLRRLVGISLIPGRGRAVGAGGWS